MFKKWKKGSMQQIKVLLTNSFGQVNTANCWLPIHKASIRWDCR